MIHLYQIAEYLEGIAPLHLQEDYDNAGLIFGNKSKRIKKVLCSLDCIEEVVDEAIDNSCDLVVSHHPIIFRGIKKFGDYYVHRVIEKAIKNDISLYAIHTNLDNVLKNGVNEQIGKKLLLQDIDLLLTDRDDSNAGKGAIGQLREEMSEIDFLDHVGQCMQCNVIKHTRFLNRPIKKVALCGGSGAFLINSAINQGADAYITSDLKYHDYFEADGSIFVLDIGHYESEQFTTDLLVDLLRMQFSNLEIMKTNTNTNPVKCFIGV